MVILITVRKVGESTPLPYAPEVPEALGLEVKSFVVAAVTDVGGETPYSSRDLLLVTTRLCVWATANAGLELDRRTLFNRHVIERFIAVGLPDFNEAARGNLRSQLLRVAEVLLDPRDVPARLRPMKAADPSQPYSDREVVVLRTWASTQSTNGRRANALTLLALGLGAGLSAAEIGSITTDDVVVHERRVDLTVTAGRRRTVPVLSEWEEALRLRSVQLGPSRYLFRENHRKNYDNLISNFVARGRSVEVVPQSQRMRATWIVRHLSRGVPVIALMRAAGVDSLEAFTRYARFVHDEGRASFEYLR